MFLMDRRKDTTGSRLCKLRAPTTIPFVTRNSLDVIKMKRLNVEGFVCLFVLGFFWVVVFSPVCLLFLCLLLRSRVEPGNGFA